MSSRLLPVVVWLLTLRSVGPGAYDLLTLGRPAPGSPRPLSEEARALGVLLAVVLVVVCLRAALGGRGASISTSSVFWLVYLTLAFVSSYLNGFEPVLSVGSGLLVLLAVGRAGPLPARVLRHVTWPLLVIVYSSLLLALITPQVAKFGDPHAPWWSRDARLAGVLEQPNQMGMLAGLAVVLLASRAHHSSRRRLVHLFAAGSALVLSASYTSVIATTVALLVLWSGQSLRTASIPVAVAGTAAAAGVYHALSARIAAEGSLQTLSGRRVVWDFVVQEWPQRPLFGHGSGAWARLVSSSVVEPWAVHAHNQVLNTLYVGGVIGLAALVAALVTTAGPALAQWRRGLSLPLALVALQLVRSYTEVPFELVFGGLNLLCLVLMLVAVAAGSAGSKGSPHA